MKTHRSLFALDVNRVRGTWARSAVVPGTWYNAVLPEYLHQVFLCWLCGHDPDGTEVRTWFFLGRSFFSFSVAQDSNLAIQDTSQVRYMYCQSIIRLGVIVEPGTFLTGEKLGRRHRMVCENAKSARPRHSISVPSSTNYRRRPTILDGD